jgi:hypothetical protein
MLFHVGAYDVWLTACRVFFDSLRQLDDYATKPVDQGFGGE